MKITKTGDWQIYWGYTHLPDGAEAIGVVQRDNLETGALILLANGVYVQGNARSMRTLDQAEVKRGMSVNTKARRDEIFTAAVALVEAFGIERLDALPHPAAKAQKVAFAYQLAEQTGCHIETARIHIAKASRRMRSPDWGGTRPGSGRKKPATPHLDGEI